MDFWEWYILSRYYKPWHKTPNLSFPLWKIV